MYKDLKKIINIIKYAEPQITPIDSATESTPPPEPTNKPKKVNDPNTIDVESLPVANDKTSPKITNNYSNKSINNVKKMQESIQKFVDVVLGQGDNLAQYFNNFLTEKYVANAPTVGDQYSYDTNVTSKEQKQRTAIKPEERDNVLDTNYRIGQMKSEAKPDGVWGFRTNNALKNTYALAYAFYNLYNKLGVVGKMNLTAQDLTEFQSQIPSDQELPKLSFLDKNTRAQTITPLIVKISEFYKQFAQRILGNPNLSKYIEGREPLFRVNKTILTDDDKKRAESSYIGPLVLSGKNNIRKQFNKLPISLLENKQVLENLAEQLQYTKQEIASNPDVIKSILNQLITHVSGVLKLNNDFIKMREVAPESR